MQLSGTKNLHFAVAPFPRFSAVVNTSVAHLVMNLHPKDKSKTVLQYYQNILDIVADNIAANRI